MIVEGGVKEGKSGRYISGLVLHRTLLELEAFVINPKGGAHGQREVRGGCVAAAGPLPQLHLGVVGVREHVGGTRVGQIQQAQVSATAHAFAS
jgi:hypothetical protein